MIALVGLVLSSLFVFVLIRRTRQFVRREAPFYATWNIIIVGGSIGIIFAVVAHILGRFTTTFEGRTLMNVLTVTVGYMLAYIGYRPDPIDWAKKSKQVATVAIIIFAIGSIVTFVIDPPGPFFWQVQHT
jgi:hypothetical protein